MFREPWERTVPRSEKEVAEEFGTAIDRGKDDGLVNDEVLAVMKEDRLKRRLRRGDRVPGFHGFGPGRRLGDGRWRYAGGKWERVK